MKTNDQDDGASWELLQENLASKTGLAVIVVEGENSGIISKANNNSICERLSDSPEFGPRCAEYCGKAMEIAAGSDEPVAVRCHAGLNFLAVPVRNSGPRRLTAIIGRTFLKAEDYRIAAARAMSGDWQQFPTEDLFHNVLLTSSAHDLEKAAKSFAKLCDKFPDLIQRIGRRETAGDPAGMPELDKTGAAMSPGKSGFPHPNEEIENDGAPPTVLVNPVLDRFHSENEALDIWRSLFGSLLDSTYGEACRAVLGFIANRFELTNLSWLEHSAGNFQSTFGIGSFIDQQVLIPAPKGDRSLIDAINKETSLEFRERRDRNKGNESRHVNLFPVTTGSLACSAILAGDEMTDPKIKRQIARFLRSISWELEILRLREEVERQTLTTTAIRRLNETIKRIDSEDFWTVLSEVTAELIRAGQSSLLIQDQETKAFVVKAAVGNRADEIKNEKSELLGLRVAKKVLQGGKPLVISDTSKAGLKKPGGWEYKSPSFICYPIMIGGRNIGVLNFADKIGGGVYSDTDLHLLDNLIPQIAVAIDRRALIRKAGEFEQLSITDSLTGLVNRRYLEQRLDEEIKRSQRDGYPLCFMMIDVDTFKSFNDAYGHTEGDKALEIIGHCLTGTLRGADVAARYGGEEFSILLPQTTLTEASAIAERLRLRVENTKFPNRQVTISIGVSTCSKTMCKSLELISDADKALYEAKRHGRNNVQVYGVPGPTGGSAA